MKYSLYLFLIIFNLISCSNRDEDFNNDSLNDYLILAIEEDYSEFEESVYSSGYTRLGQNQLKLFNSIHAHLDSLRKAEMSDNWNVKANESIESIRSIMAKVGLDSEEKLISLLTETKNRNEFNLNSKIFEVRLLNELKEEYIKGLYCFDVIEPKFEGKVISENGEKFYKGRANLKASQSALITEYSTVMGGDTLKFKSYSNGYTDLKIPVTSENEAVDINASVFTYFGERKIPATIKLK